MLKKKVVFLPLDERPCNYVFPQALFREAVNLTVPQPTVLGDKKTPADADGLIAFLRRECADADALVCSLDMLLYGGLLPSRLHFLSRETLDKRLALLRELKEKNARLKIYAFSLIMRCPKYSSSEEEPDYYADCGAEIHVLGTLVHKRILGIEKNEKEETRLRGKITKANEDDFLNRRKNNLVYNRKAIELKKEGTIDVLVIPQDDSSPYGYTAMDQAVVRDKIEEEGLAAQILMYPGADEAGLTLLTRCLMDFKNKRPRIWIKYAAENADALIPSYEDRPLGETVKYHILAAGGKPATSYADADVVLCLTANSQSMAEAKYQSARSVAYDSFRNLPELFAFMKDALNDGKSVALADNAYANGGDLKLISMLDGEGLLSRLAAYAGWNTNANTIGTALAQGFVYFVNGATQSHYDFLALRYLEDCGYCSCVRFSVSERLSRYGYNYFWVEEQRGKAALLVEEQLNEFLKKSLPSIADEVKITDVYLPWRRMFEVGIEARWKRTQ